jgi:hypothetical protein
VSRWAATHPELYDSLIRRGIARWVRAELERYALPGPATWSPDFWDGVSQAVVALCEYPDVQDLLRQHARKQVQDEEADYRARLIDSAKARKGGA